jgi:tRNA U34 5-methylaminomethyl-2-thiouridine-forming methyltransferase MnmC
VSFELVTLKNGLKSLRCAKSRETFHPVTGPLAEADTLHVQQQRIRERAQVEGEFLLWDVGFGAAANAIAALNAFQGLKAQIHSFDKSLEPIQFALEHAEELGYLQPYRETLEALISSGEARLGQVQWFLHLGDFREQLERSDLPAPSGIFYDPYSPASNPEMWALEHFRKLRARLDPDRLCLLTNYTRSTSVRATLLLAGFAVGYGRAVGEKDQTTVAANSLSALEHPLERNWLERVKVSRNSGPMRGEAYPGPISAQDLAALESLSQFER